MDNVLEAIIIFTLAIVFVYVVFLLIIWLFFNISFPYEDEWDKVYGFLPEDEEDEDEEEIKNTEEQKKK